MSPPCLSASPIVSHLPEHPGFANPLGSFFYPTSACPGPSSLSLSLFFSKSTPRLERFPTPTPLCLSLSSPLPHPRQPMFLWSGSKLASLDSRQIESRGSGLTYNRNAECGANYRVSLRTETVEGRGVSRADLLEGPIESAGSTVSARSYRDARQLSVSNTLRRRPAENTNVADQSPRQGVSCRGENVRRGQGSRREAELLGLRVCMNVSQLVAASFGWIKSE